MLDLAVVVVTWNNENIVVDTLQSVIDDLKNSSLSYQVWVVDNASSDESVNVVREQFPDVKLIASPDNLGFARANNFAMRQMGFDGNLPEDELPRAVYLLNPDTFTHRGATETLFQALMADDAVGVVGARLTFGDGSFQHSAFMFPGLKQIWAEFFPTPGRLIEGAFNGRYERGKYQQEEPFEVDFTLGATMMLKREVLVQTGLFDEDFLIYCEEVDWAWRIRDAGWEILCVPQAHVTHLGGQSTSQVKPWSVINLWKSRLQLYDKHYPAWKRLLARQLVAWGMKRKMRDLQQTDPQANEVMSAYQTVYQMATS